MTVQPAFDPSRLMVTGHSGFIGKHFCAAYGGIPLTDQDGLVDLSDSLRVRSAVAAIAPQAVLHLAAQSSVADSFHDPAATIATNFLGTLNLLQALNAMRFQGAFLYVGSADVYGRVTEDELPARETQPLRPRSPYAVSKVAAEALCYQWSQTENFRIVLTRPFNQIGPAQDRRFVIADVAWQIREMRHKRTPPLLVTGDIDVTRDFTDVRDTVRAYRMLIESGLNGEVYNICSGHESSVRSLVLEMLSIAGVQAELKVDPARLRPGEQRRMVGDPQRINKDINWMPRIPLETTLADLLNEMENRTL